MKKQKLWSADGTNDIGGALPLGDIDDSMAAANQAKMIGELLCGKDLHRPLGLKVGNVFFSAELLLLAALLVVNIVIVRKLD